jgi:alkyl hydroperoxide reductase subunit F
VNVKVYSTEGCPFCEKAKSFLKEKGIEFIDVPASPGSAAWQEMKRKTGSGALPQILVNDASVGGYADLVTLETSGRLYEMLGQAGRKSETPLYDVIILGAGPAGLSAAIYAIRKVMKTLIISKDVGGQVTWTADVDNYLGFSQVNAAELVAKFEDHVKKFGVEKVIGRNVSVVDPTGRIKRVVTDDGRIFYGKTLIVATGGGHKLLDVPGEKKLQGKGVSYCSTCDAPLYDGADVAVIGGGNSALEAVIDLMNIASRIYVVSISPIMGDPVYRDKVEASEKVTVFSQHQPIRILGESFVEGIEFKCLITGQVKTMNVEGVFVEIGTMPNSSLFIDNLATNQKGEILVDLECRTGIAGVFACGDVTNVPFKQVVVAVGEGAKAALSAYNYLINQK